MEEKLFWLVGRVRIFEWRLLTGFTVFQMIYMLQGLGINNTLLLPCGRSRLLQPRGRVFAFRSCGPGSIPTWAVGIFLHPVTPPPPPTHWPPNVTGCRKVPTARGGNRTWAAGSKGKHSTMSL